MNDDSIHSALAPLCLAFSGLILTVTPVHASTILGNAQNFAVLAASAVTNTGATTIGGDLGVFPGPSMTGAGTITLSGATHLGDSVAQAGMAGASNAYTILQALGPSRNLSGSDLGGLTFTSRVYRFDASAQLTGVLTIDFAGASNSDVVFQIGSTLTTASASQALIRNVGANDGVCFAAGSSATLGSSSSFAGNIIAHDNVSFGSTAGIQCGRAFALSEGVQMVSNTIAVTNCAATNGVDLSAAYSAGDFTKLGYTGGQFDGVAGAFTPSVPEPATVAMLTAGLLRVGALGSRRFR
jgi:type VI secretion system secreted protein VgrG